MTEETKVKHFSFVDLCALEERIAADSISKQNPINYATLIGLVKYARTLLEITQEDENNASYDKDFENIEDLINIPLLTDIIAEGNNKEALLLLHEAFPDRARHPSAVLDLIKCHGRKTFEDKIGKVT